jgi:hypothetical protein
MLPLVLAGQPLAPLHPHPVFGLMLGCLLLLAVKMAALERLRLDQVQALFLAHPVYQLQQGPVAGAGMPETEET